MANIRHSRAGGNPAYKARASRSFRAERGKGGRPKIRAVACWRQRANVRVPRYSSAGFRLSRLCKNSENPDPHEKLPTGMAHSAIPAKAGIQHIKRARFALLLRQGAARPSLQCARTALHIALDSCFRRNGGAGFIRWVPAAIFAQPAAREWRDGLFFRHSRGSGNPASGYLRARHRESAHMAHSAIPALQSVQKPRKFRVMFHRRHQPEQKAGMKFQRRAGLARPARRRLVQRFGHAD